MFHGQAKYGKAGQCYAACFHLLSNGDTPDGCVLVHGYPTITRDPDKGKVYGHAWLEWPGGAGLDWCVDHLHLDNPIPAKLFYLVGRIDPDLCKRYTLDEAWRQAEETGHYGVWHEAPAGVHFVEGT